MAEMHINYQLTQGTGAVGEPIRQNNWEVIIPELGDVHLFAQNFKLPEMDVEEIEVRHMNAATKIAGKVSFSNATIRIRDVISPDIAKRAKEWHNKVFNPETKQLNYASEYKKVGFARRYDSKGALMREYALYGLWPKKLNHGDMDYTKAEGVELEMELACDYFLID